jgi:hypothetical protein
MASATVAMAVASASVAMAVASASVAMAVVSIVEHEQAQEVDDEADAAHHENHPGVLDLLGRDKALKERRSLSEVPARDME